MALLRILSCFVAGILVSLGFLFISGMVTYLSTLKSGQFNILVAICVFFSFMVSLTNHVLIKPAIEGKTEELHSSGRFLFFIIGMWLIIIPYIDIEAYKIFIMEIIVKFAFLITRVF
jgi:hypothetical protein